jgi:prepilin-type N-terminal cleavage/methylation domain-containing protein
MSRQRGFSLIELGIVIGVIAVLALVILIGRGMITSARSGSATQMVDSIRKAARVYAERSNGGRDFAGGGGLPTISMDQLRALSLISGSGQTPWNSVVTVSAVAGDPPSIQVQFCAESTTQAQDMEGALRGMGTVTRANGTVGGTACPATGMLTVVTR